MRDVNIDAAPIEALLQALGQRLDALRIDRRLKNEDLAKKAGVNRNTLTRIWKGKPVSTETLLRVLRALGALDLVGQLLVEPRPSPIELLEAAEGKGHGKTKTKVYDPRTKGREEEKALPKHSEVRLATANREEILKRYRKPDKEG